MRLDDSGALVEVDNLCPTEEALLQLTDVERVLELFGDDVLLHAAAAGSGAGRGVPAADGKKDADAPDAGAMGARKNCKVHNQLTGDQGSVVVWSTASLLCLLGSSLLV